MIAVFIIGFISGIVALILAVSVGMLGKGGKYGE
jgi:hypothetical protein